MLFCIVLNERERFADPERGPAKLSPYQGRVLPTCKGKEVVHTYIHFTKEPE